MTRKDYIRIADVIRHTYETIGEHPQDDSRATLNRLTNRMASMLSEDNALFDTDRFWSACDPTSVSE